MTPASSFVKRDEASELALTIAVSHEVGAAAIHPRDSLWGHRLSCSAGSASNTMRANVHVRCPVDAARTLRKSLSGRFVEPWCGRRRAAPCLLACVIGQKTCTKHASRKSHSLPYPFAGQEFFHHDARNTPLLSAPEDLP